MNPQPLFEGVDPEVMARVRLSRREALVKAGKAGLGAAVLTSIPVAFGLSARQAFGQSSTPATVLEALNFALTLEYLEDEFYRTGLAAATAMAIPTAEQRVFQIISAHETAHVALLRTTITQLGGTPVAKPAFDFTAKGTFPTVFTSYATFKAVAQAFEDTGERAYKGQAGAVASNDTVLTVALQIHAIEARHAAMLRRMNGTKGWKTGNAPNSGPTAAIYAGEDNTTQGGVPLTTALTGFTAAQISEAFDEPLTKAAVLAIVQPFLV